MRDKTLEKHEEIYACYIKELKEAGEFARMLPKKEFYGRVADRFFIEPEYVGRIINNMLRRKRK